MYLSAFFDLDGTLLNTIQDLASAGNYVRRSWKLPPLPVEKYKVLVGDGIPRLVERLLPFGTDKESISHGVQLFHDYYTAHGNDTTMPYPGIVETLHTLKRHSTQLAVLSNKADSFTQQLVQHHFPGLFDLVLGQTDAFPPKPSPDSLLYAMQLLQSAPNSSLVIGDSNNDMIVAYNAHITCCGVTWGFRSEDELLQAGADHIVHSPDGLLSIILTNN